MAGTASTTIVSFMRDLIRNEYSCQYQHEGRCCLEDIGCDCECVPGAKTCCGTLEFADYATEEHKSQAIRSLLTAQFKLIDELKKTSDEGRIDTVEELYTQAILFLHCTPIIDLSKGKLEEVADSGIPHLRGHPGNWLGARLRTNITRSNLGKCMNC